MEEKLCEIEMKKDEDQLSYLPKFILHNILSRLPEKDAARTSVLSKSWLETWDTFPILSFCDTKIIRMSLQPMEDIVKKGKIFRFCDHLKRKMLRFGDYVKSNFPILPCSNTNIPETFPQTMDGFQRKREYFIDYVKRTLMRFCDQRLAIKEFKLSVTILELRGMSRDFDLWLKLASENGVEVLRLCLHNFNDQFEEDRSEFYVLPKGIIEAKSLTKLVLMGEIRVDQAFMSHSIKFFSLRELHLCYVILGDEHAIEHLISCCPLIESITLKFLIVLSSGDLMKSLNVHGLQKLKTVDVKGIEEVYIDEASILENLCYEPGYLDTPFEIDSIRCKNLKELFIFSLESIIITDTWFLELFPKFPFLERLNLCCCDMFERINISSVQLKYLKLSHFSNLKEVNIDAPNLLSFEYYGGYVYSKPVICFLRSTSQLEVNVHMDIDYLDNFNLKEILQNIKPKNVLISLSLSIFHYTMDANRVMFLDISSPPISIKNLDLLYIPNDETWFSSLVNDLLLSCLPQTISLSLDPFCCNKSAFIEFLYEMLKRRKEEDCFCNSSDTKCWWHGLKDVKVTSSMMIDENVDFKTLLDSFTNCVAHDKISFMLEF